MIASLLLFLALAAPAAAANANLERALRARDQALMDAFAPGDRAAWEAALRPAPCTSTKTMC